MTDDDARAVVLGALATVAPELDVRQLDPDADLRLSADLDSMDFLSYVAALSDVVDSDIPESEYEQVSTINGAVTLMARRAR